jgi:hypothetical protein
MPSLSGSVRCQLHQDDNSGQRDGLLHSVSQTDERVERIQATFLYASGPGRPAWLIANSSTRAIPPNSPSS